MSPAPRIGRALYDWREAKKLAEREQLGAPAAEATLDLTPAEIAVADTVEVPDEQSTETTSPSSADLNARLAALDAEHNATMTAAGERYEVERRRLLDETKLAEIAESRKTNEAIAPSIAEVLEAVRQGNRTSLTSERAGSDRVRDEQIAEQRAWVAPVLEDAKRAAREIRKFANRYDETINAVLAMSLTTLRAGLPLQGIAAERSVALTNGVLRNAELARTLIDGTLRTIEEQGRAIETLFRKSHVWGGPKNSHGVRSQESVRELNQLIHDLGHPSEVIPTLNSLISGIGGHLAAIAALRDQYKDSPVLKLDVEKMMTASAVEELRETAEGKREFGNAPAPTRAVMRNPRGLFEDNSVVGGA